MRLREHLRHLRPKTEPWLQGAWLLDVTHRVQCPHDKKEAAKKSLDLKKVLPCFPHQHGKIVSLLRRVRTLHCFWLQCAGTIKSKPRVCKGLRWPQ